MFCATFPQFLVSMTENSQCTIIAYATKDKKTNSKSKQELFRHKIMCHGKGN